MPSTYVPPKGSLDAKYVIIGEQPGRNEVLHRDLGPFSGPAGKNLQECLHAAGILWSDCYRTNVIKDFDYPLDSYIEVRSGKNAGATFTAMGNKHISILQEELRSTTSNVIVVCGNVALWALCSRIGITHWRGSILDSTLLPKRKVLPIIHPATWTQEKLYSNPDAYLNKYLCILDLKKARTESEFPEIRALPRKLSIQPTYYDACNFISMCMERADAGATIDYDIEVQPHNQELSCIGLAFNSSWAMCIPFIGPQGDYFSVEQELHIMLLLDELFHNPKWAKRGQNVIFDSHYMLKKYGIHTHNLHDTMIAQSILYPEMRKALEFITSMWTDIPYYKHDGKQFLGGITNWEKAWQYNCNDVLSTADAHPKQLRELAEQGNLSTYERQRLLIPPLTFMMEHGVKVDTDGMKRAAIECTTEIAEAVLEISSLIGRQCVADKEDIKTGTEINLSSPQQLMEYFYGRKGIKPYTNPNTGNPTIDVTALTRIANQGYKEARLILQVRRLAKRKSTFLNTEQISSDGRMRCQYNPVGTKFGRVSSSESIFGDGVNMQNQPHDVLTYFVADDGYVIYSLDMSQIENRIVAYVGNIVSMIDAFENGIDVHRLTAAMTLTLLGQFTTPELVTSEQRQDYGKRPNHAFNYGYGYKSYSLRYEIPEREAKLIFTAYHTAYPGLRNSYWAYVQQELKATRTLTTLMNRRIVFLSMWSDKLLHEAYSAIPQSTCGDHVNERGLEFIYYNTSDDFKSVELLNQIHDSVEFQMPLSVPLSTHARVLIAIKESLETPLEWKGHKFVVPVDLTVGKCLNKEVGIEIKNKDFANDVSTLEQQLQKAVERLGLYEIR